MPSPKCALATHDTAEAPGRTPTDLGDNKIFAERIIQGFLQRQKTQMLYGDLGRAPFYQADDENYFLTGIDIGVQLPWTRIFEIDLTTDCHFGKASHTSNR